ncbi:SGNH/GDSL hydrolase family protein [Chitinophaga varians]|uniref:SGNH/GDSL hydrolase family protein n=1 Tax=Chitinophaga varians TaxID=2202339 RepID=UPI00165FBC25|nr:SGNH/GDSL hydrolase family protein [Chitinophaga varians]MBC9914083.1 SGNH/GDSL hydrolase family protein [Chitinophaga varians]
MNKLILSIFFLLTGIVASAQGPISIEKDSIKILNAELVLRNKTRDVNGYLFNTGDGKTLFRKLGKTIQFRVGDPGYPIAGDSVYQHTALANYVIKVMRNGLLQYRRNTNGVNIDDQNGKIVFYPALQANDNIYIEALGGIDLSLDGSDVNIGSPVAPATVLPKAGVSESSGKAFLLRWGTNAKTLYINPRVVGIGSSTLAGYGLNYPDRLGDKIAAWLTANTFNPTWENLAVAGYSSKDLLPILNGGTLGHNIETALSMGPDFIFVSLPSNDPSAGITVNESIVNLKTIDTLAMLKGVPVFFETTQPRTSYTPAQQGLLRQLADSIRSIWPQRYVEGFKDLVDPATPGAILPIYNKGDGIHLTSAGNQLIANALFERWLDYFQAVKGVKRYVIDSSLDKTNWAIFAQEQEGNVVKRSFPRFDTVKQFFRIKAELKDGTSTPYSNIATLEEKHNPAIPGVNDYSYRLLVDLGGDGVNTINGSNGKDGKPTVSPDSWGKYWNNWYGIGGVTGFADQAAIARLRTTTNAGTKMSIQLLGSPTGTFGSSATQAINYNGFLVPVGDYPMEAIYDNMFIHSSKNPDGVTFRIRGLIKTNMYYIKLWGARLDDNTTPRTLQARLGDETWATAQSVDNRYASAGTPDYNRAVTFNHITGVDSVDIVMRTGGNSAFAHVSLIDIGVMGNLPAIPQLTLRDSSTTLSTMQLTAVPINGATMASYQWTQISGPNTVTINNSTGPTAGLSGLTNGTFIFNVSGTTTDGDGLSAQATVKVYPNNNGKKTLRVHFSKTAATSIPGWFNVYNPGVNQRIIMTDPVTNWTVDNVSTSSTYWSPLGGAQAADTTGSTTGNNSGVIPDIVLRAFWFNYSVRYTTGTDNLLIKGLIPGRSYTLKLYASRSAAVGEIRYGAWRVNGGSELLQDAANNTSRETVVSAVADASGNIKIAVYAPTNSATNGNNSYLNALIVQED